MAYTPLTRVKLVWIASLLVLWMPVEGAAQKRPVKTQHKVLKHNTQVVIKPYRPWCSFKNDTLAYLKYNFYERRNAYTQKSFIHLYDDFEVKPVDFIPAVDMVNDVDRADGVLMFFSPRSLEKQKGNYNEPGKKLDSLILYVQFTEFHNCVADFEIIRKYKRESFLPLVLHYKNMVIKKMLLPNYVVPQPSPKPPKKTPYQRYFHYK